MRNIIITASFLFCTVFINAQETVQHFTLKEAINYALKNSYAIKKASLDIKSAEKKKWETTTIGLPQINADIEYQDFLKQIVTLIPGEFTGGAPGTFDEVTFGTKQNLHATATVKQLLFDGSYLIGLQSAKTFLKISELAKVKTKKAIKEAVINAYGNVLLAQESFKITGENQKLLKKNLFDTEQIVKNGLTEEQDAEQLQINLANVTNQLHKAQRFLNIAQKMFNLTLGIDISTKVKLTENLEKLVLNNTDLTLLSKPLDLKNHIDYKIAKNNKKSSELLMKYQMSKALPSLSAFVNYSKFANSDGFTFFSKDQKWFNSSLLGVSMNIPIFSSLKRSAKTQQAKIALEKAEINLTETSQKIKLNAENAKSNYEFAIDEYFTNKKNLILSQKIEHKESIKFFEGIGSSFNLTAAQNQLYKTQKDYLQSIVNIINTKVKLENALNTQGNL